MDKRREIAKLKQKLKENKEKGVHYRALEQQYIRRKLRALGSYRQPKEWNENIRQARLRAPVEENKRRGRRKKKGVGK